MQKALIPQLSSKDDQACCSVTYRTLGRGQRVVVNVAFDIGKVGSGTTKKSQSSVTPSQNILILSLSLKDTNLCCLELKT